MVHKWSTIATFHIYSSIELSASQCYITLHKMLSCYAISIILNCCSCMQCLDQQPWHTHSKSLIASTSLLYEIRSLSTLFAVQLLPMTSTSHFTLHNGKAPIYRLDCFVCSSLEELCDPVFIYTMTDVCFWEYLQWPCACWCSKPRGPINLYISVTLKNNDDIRSWLLRAIVDNERWWAESQHRKSDGWDSPTV